MFITPLWKPLRRGGSNPTAGKAAHNVSFRTAAAAASALLLLAAAAPPAQAAPGNGAWRAVG